MITVLDLKAEFSRLTMLKGRTPIGIRISLEGEKASVVSDVVWGPREVCARADRPAEWRVA